MTLGTIELADFAVLLDTSLWEAHLPIALHGTGATSLEGTATSSGFMEPTGPLVTSNSSSGSLTKTGAGNLVLSQTNLYNTPIVPNSGINILPSTRFNTATFNPSPGPFEAGDLTTGLAISESASPIAPVHTFNPGSFAFVDGTMTLIVSPNPPPPLLIGGTLTINGGTIKLSGGTFLLR